MIGLGAINNNQEILLQFFSFLTVDDLLHVNLVSKLWYNLTSDNVVWIHHVDQLWKSKIHIPQFSVIFRQVSAKFAYFASLYDSKRTFLCVTDLAGTEWSFRFKKSAGLDWLALCPWNQGLPASSVFFKNNGVLERRMGNAPRNVSVHYHGVQVRYRMRVRHMSPRKRPFYGSHVAFIALMNSVQEKRPEFISFKTHLKNSFSYLFGSYNRELQEVAEGLDEQYGDIMQISLNGIAVPTYTARRSPTGNWGFVLESCWAVYTSWPMPLKGTCQDLEDEALQVTISSQWLEVQQYNRNIVQAI